jgi:hypothetical protein
MKRQALLAAAIALGSCSSDGRGHGAEDGGGRADAGGGADSGPDAAGDSGDSGVSVPGPSIVCAARFGEPDGFEIVEAVAVDLTGAVYLVGRFEALLRVGDDVLEGTAGMSTVFVARLDATCIPVWARTVPGATAASVSAGTDGAILAGDFREEIDLEPAGTLVARGERDGFVARMTSEGAFEWATQLGSPADDGVDAVAADGAAAYVYGRLGSIDPAALSLVRLEADGGIAWQREFEWMRPGGLAVGGDGTAFFVGGANGRGSPDFGGGPLAGGGESATFVVAIGSDDIHRWSRRFAVFATEWEDERYRIAVAPSGELTLAGGVYDGTVDFGGGAVVQDGSFVVVGLDGDGGHVSSRSYRATAPHSGLSAVAVDSEGARLFAGGQTGGVDFGGGELGAIGNPGGGAFIAKLNASGDHVWSALYDGGNRFMSLGVAGDGAAVAAGQLSGTMDLGDRVLETAGGEGSDDDDALVIRFAP